MITRDPYGISGAVAPWRSLDAIEPIVERNITERDAEEAAICGQCPLPDCNPKRVGCLLHTRAKKPKPSRDLLERMALDGYGPETIAQATGDHTLWYLASDTPSMIMNNVACAVNGEQGILALDWDGGLWLHPQEGDDSADAVHLCDDIWVPESWYSQQQSRNTD